MKPSDATFQWEDPLLLDEELTGEERLVRDTARDYCREKLMPRVLTANREERLVLGRAQTGIRAFGP